MSGGLHRIGAVARRNSGKLVVLCLQIGLLAACAHPEAPPLPPRVDIPHGQGRIWQIDREGLPSSYVFGTLHVTDPRVRSLPVEVGNAFRRSQIAAFEVVDDPDREEEDDFGIDRVKLPEGTTLRSLIGAHAYGQLTSIMQGRGYYKPRNDLKPWVFWDYLGGPWGTFYGNDRKSSPENEILDDWLERRAREDHKEVVGLETVEESFAIFDEMPMKTQVALLQASLENYHDYTFGVPRVKFYLDGDLAQLRALWEERLSWLDPETARVLDDRLLNDRNRKMVARMIPLMEKASTFVGVGAAHMAGEQGILRLLEQEGFTVTRLD